MAINCIHLIIYLFAHFSIKFYKVTYRINDDDLWLRKDFKKFNIDLRVVYITPYRTIYTGCFFFVEHKCNTHCLCLAQNGKFIVKRREILRWG